MDKQVIEWINIGELTNFQSGSNELILYVNTVNLVWHIGVINDE